MQLINIFHNQVFAQAMIVLIFLLIVAVWSYFGNIDKTSPGYIAKQIKKQDKRNIRYIKDILKGHYIKLTKEQIAQFIEKYSVWVQQEKQLVSTTSKERLFRQGQYRNEFKVSFMFLDELLPEEESPFKLAFKDAFTEPFPSTHDMDDWAFVNKVTDILALKGYNPREERLVALVHKKEHFVNHDITTGIIIFDIYLLEE
ncbi:MAG TPA: hypothetical protein VGE63_01260 [Candidatus Paceibacterota bacterium]